VGPELDGQYRQEQTESKLLSHSHVMHKPHKMTGGGHKKAQARQLHGHSQLANAVTPKCACASDISISCKTPMPWT